MSSIKSMRVGKVEKPRPLKSASSSSIVGKGGKTTFIVCIHALSMDRQKQLYSSKAVSALLTLRWPPWIHSGMPMTSTCRWARSTSKSVAPLVVILAWGIWHLLRLQSSRRWIARARSSPARHKHPRWMVMVIGGVESKDWDRDGPEGHSMLTPSFEAAVLFHDPVFFVVCKVQTSHTFI